MMATETEGLGALSPEQKRALLARRLARAGPGRRTYPLSFAQQRFWFLDRLAPGSNAYNGSRLLRLTGSLDVEALRRALTEIVRRHETLRTTFEESKGEPVQVVAPAIEPEIPLIDLRGISGALRDAELLRLAAEEAAHPYILAEGPLWRFRVYALAEQDHALQLASHHIVADGWSAEVLFRELEALYPAFLAGRPSPLADLLIQYGDFALWQREWFRGDVLDRQVRFWREQLGDRPPRLELPSDRPRPPVQTFRPAEAFLTLPPVLAEAVLQFNRAQGVTLFMTLLAAFEVLLSRHTGHDDVVVGTPIANRNRAETEDLVGFFINTLVLRTRLAGASNFLEVLSRVRETALNAFAHQDLPFEKLLEELHPERDLSRTPLFQVFFNMLIVPPPLRLPGLRVALVTLPEIASNFDLTLYAGHVGERIDLKLLYNADLFAEDRMGDLLEQLEQLLAGVIAHPDWKIDAHSLVTARAARRLPDPHVSLDPGRGGPLHTLAAAGLGRSGEGSLAVAGPGESLTYGELEAGSNRLAHHLIQSGIGRGDIVAVAGRRAEALPWALLGVLKAGAAFLVLDPAQPPARLAHQLRTARPRGLIVLEEMPGSAVEDILSDLAPRGRLDVAVAGLTDILADRSTAPPDVTVQSTDLAYLMFTSGSTGAAKAIAGDHGPVAHFLDWQASTFGLSAKDRFSLLSGLGHDPLLRDVFAPLRSGATLCVPSAEKYREPEALTCWLAEEKITVSHVTPPLIRMLRAGAVARSLPDLRWVFFGGDQLTAGDAVRALEIAPSARCVNFYGATETPQAMAWYPVTPEDLALPAEDWPLPVGRGIDDVQLILVNEYGEPAGIGELAEIRVRTPYLTRGYLDAGSTAWRFIPDPAGVGRIYRTGDLGRYLPNGDVQFVGRSDRQVKIRGFRVEPGEVEAALRAHSGLSDVAVIPRGSGAERALVAYLVVRGTKRPSVEELLAEARRTLSEEMLPASFVFLDAIPRAGGGKVDAQALPPPEAERPDLHSAYEPPRTELERTIARVWKEVLARDRVGIHDNFFALGGHSLLAAQVVSRIRAALSLELPLRRIFDCPTVSQLARSMELVRGTAVSGPRIRALPRENYRRRASDDETKGK